MYVYLLMEDDEVVGVYRKELDAENDMQLCKQGDTLAGRTSVYEIRMMTLIEEV